MMNMKMSSCVGKKGFTLIEVLIVVMIIAVLAALVIPRFAGQGEKARVAEAAAMLGAIRRALLQYADENQGTCPAAIATADGFMAILGIGVPAGGNAADATLAASDDWQYETFVPAGGLNGASSCRATRINSPGAAGTITLGLGAGSWAGTGDYLTNAGRFWSFL